MDECAQTGDPPSPPQRGGHVAHACREGERERGRGEGGERERERERKERAAPLSVAPAQAPSPLHHTPHYTTTTLRLQHIASRTSLWPCVGARPLGSTPWHRLLPVTATPVSAIDRRRRRRACVGVGGGLERRLAASSPASHKQARTHARRVKHPHPRRAPANPASVVECRPTAQPGHSHRARTHSLHLPGWLWMCALLACWPACLWTFLLAAATAG